MLPDTLLGHYRILHPLGKGGMGEVYAAEDTRLHRTVALKLLPATMAHDPDRRKRFEREAQAVAALNHPNIVTIHSVEEASGVMFLTMEAVEGRTLGEVMAGAGLPLQTLLNYAVAISDALAAAHQRGITHRDLKPANVMVTADGRVKVLDFGLAKLREAEHDAAAEQPTMMQSGDLTGEGRIIGTVAYMSPEQAEGKPVDARSDIFSAGVLLHEMASGERPFKGDTNISVISSILKETPSSITDLKPELPAGLARIVRRCLAKDPARRYQTATDLRNDIEELKQDLDSGVLSGSSVRPAVHDRRAPSKWLVVGLAVAALAIVAAAVAWIKSGREGTAAAPVQFTAERFTPLTTSGSAHVAALSRDGRYVVHVKVEGGHPSVWVRQTATTSDVRIVPPADVRYDGLVFSPDGNYVYYVVYPPNRGVASLYRVPTLGGPPLRVLEDIDGAPAFSPDGARIAFIRGDVVGDLRHLMLAAVDGSGARSLAAPAGEVRFQNEQPAWSPDGRTILVAGMTEGSRPVVTAVDADSGAVSVVGEPWLYVRNMQWLPDGRSFLVDGVDRISTTQPQLWQIDYPSASRRRITNDLNGYQGVSLSADGTLLATVQGVQRADLWVSPPNGAPRKVEIAGGRAVGTGGVASTADGRVVFTSDIGGLPQLWIARPDGSELRQLTADEALFSGPAVSPDDKWIYYTRGTATDVALWRMGMDGTDPRQLTNGIEATRPIVSPDGRWVYFSASRGGGNRPMKMPAAGGEAVALTDELFTGNMVSPDGTLLMGIAWSGEKSRSECAVLPTGGGKLRLLGDVPVASGGIVGTCAFYGDTSRIAYGAVRGGMFNVYVQPIGGGAETQMTRFDRNGPPSVFAGAWARDGSVIVSRGALTSDVVLIATKVER